MSFEQQVFLTILDKGLLAIALALVAGLVKWWLQRDQARKDLVREIAAFRAEAYASFWKRTEPFRRTDPDPITEDVRSTALEQLNRVYFDEGGAMYLSHQAASRLIRAKQLLKNKADEQDVREAFSRFRTQLKTDLSIYTRRDAGKRLPTAEETSG
jgi:hypothetical protein